ncbi:hypothetical protein FPV67DRAFT_1668766 [Lyophyllum atratum]|nr:hypothetical protein FPV67DRAFT_1668766 [Lyophyllum atratum]
MSSEEAQIFHELVETEYGYDEERKNSSTLHHVACLPLPTSLYAMSSDYHPSSDGLCDVDVRPWDIGSQLPDNFDSSQQERFSSPDSAFTPRASALQANVAFKKNFAPGGILDSQITSQQFVDNLHDKLDKTAQEMIEKLKRRCSELNDALDRACLQHDEALEALKESQDEVEHWREAAASAANILLFPDKPVKRRRVQ